MTPNVHDTKCQCGAIVPVWMRFHWTGPGEGHYVRPKELAEQGRPKELAEQGSAGTPVAEEPTVYRAPPPGPKPERQLWASEENLRWAGIRLLETLGYQAYNLEQGHRPDGGHTRVGVGVPDAYFQGHGVRGWIEFKRWDNAQSEEQLRFEAHELENGGIYLLVYDNDQIRRWHEVVKQQRRQR